MSLLKSGIQAGPGSPESLPRSELTGALASCRRALISVGLFSGVINILTLTGAVFMLQVYDRVLPSRSIPTLIALVVLAGCLLAAQGVLELIRTRVLVRIAGSVYEQLVARVYDVIVRLPLKSGGVNDGKQSAQDLDTIRSFLSGPGPAALFDVPWVPFFLAVLFLLHPALGLTALVGAICLVLLTLLTEVLTRAPSMRVTAHRGAIDDIASVSLRNAEALTAMGMAGRVRDRWKKTNDDFLSSQRRVSDVAGGVGSASRTLRLMLQSAVLGIGAYLVIGNEATAGIIIAAAILTARALAPVDLTIANWKGFVAARQSWRRLANHLALLPAQETLVSLPAPVGDICVRGVSAAPPGETRLVVNDVSFALKSGQGLGIIGPSGSGKSSLARLLVGVWEVTRGEIRIDGATLSQWGPEDLGSSIGYMPQDVELFSGSVAENIARFEPNADSKDIIAAAKAAGTHEFILGLSDGYQTPVGKNGAALSAGQQQRVALARALYRDPFLVVLDEPNSNLDAEGEQALTAAIAKIRARGGIVIVIAHRPNAISAVDQLLVMAQGRMQSFGPKDEVLAKSKRPSTPAPLLKIVAEGKGRRL